MQRLRLLGWVCLLAVSAGTGSAMTSALVGGRVAPSDRTAVAPPPAAGDGERWILVVSSDHLGGEPGVPCLTAANRVSANVVQVASVDFDRVIVDLRCAGYGNEPSLMR